MIAGECVDGAVAGYGGPAPSGAGPAAPAPHDEYAAHVARQWAATRRATAAAVFDGPAEDQMLWERKEARQRARSPFGRLEGWRLAAFIVKARENVPSLRGTFPL